MTYNPRIKNKKGNKLQVTGSLLTGSVADFNVVSGSVLTGSEGKFGAITVDSITVETINIANTIDTTASYALDSDKLDGLNSTDFVKTVELSNLTVTIQDVQNISGSKTFKSVLSGGTATFSETVTVTNLNSTNDITVNSLKIGHGFGDISTNTIIGAQALILNSIGEGNTAIGQQSLSLNTSGSYNVAIGNSTLLYNTVGNLNTAVGWSSLLNNLIGENNVAVGAAALNTNTSGSFNVAVGQAAMYTNLNGEKNTAIGYSALTNNETGSYNIAIGSEALFSNTSGSSNIAIGNSSLLNATTGSNNIVIGKNAGLSLTDGSNNIFLGNEAGSSLTNISDTFILKLGSNERLRIDNSGNVGIGTINPAGYKLLVAGTLSVSSATSLNTVSGTIAEFTTLTASTINADYVTSSRADISQLTSSYVTGTDAKFTSISGTLSGTLKGNADTVTNGVYTTNISSHAITAITAGDGLSITGTIGNITLNIGAGSGINTAADSISVDSTVVRTSGDQSISGIKTFASVLTASEDAYFAKNIFVAGTASISVLNTINQSSILLGDKYLTILSGGAEHPDLNGAGFLWGTSSGPGETTGTLGEHAHILYNSDLDALSIFPGLNVEGHSKLLTVSGTSGQFTVITSSIAVLSAISATVAQHTTITASVVSASQYIGLTGGGDALTNFDNTFTAVNTFNNYYITASAGLTGSDIKATVITASVVSASQYIGLTGGGDVVKAFDNTFTAVNTFNNYYITASAGLTGSDIKATVITASVVSASQYIGLTGGGDALTSFNNTFTAVNTFNNYYITASIGITGSDAKFTTITGTLSNLTTNTAVISSNSTLNESQHIILASASTADITLTLPLAAASKFRQYIVKKIDSNSFKIIISGSSSETIDGTAGVAIGTQYEALMLVNDGVANWYVI